MAYLLDADVFICAKNLHYGLDFCPAFWDWIVANKRTCLLVTGNLRDSRLRVFDEDDESRRECPELRFANSGWVFTPPGETP